MHVQCMGDQCDTKRKPGTGQCYKFEYVVRHIGLTMTLRLYVRKQPSLGCRQCQTKTCASAKLYQNITRLHPHTHTHIAFFKKHAVGTSAQVNANKWHTVQRHVSLFEHVTPKKKNEHQTVQHTSEPADMLPHDGAFCRPTIPCLNLRSVHVLCARRYLPLTHTWKTCFIKQ